VHAGLIDSIEAASARSGHTESIGSVGMSGADWLGRGRTSVRKVGSHGLVDTFFR
jgi:hypothetical protein